MLNFRARFIGNTEVLVSFSSVSEVRSSDVAVVRALVSTNVMDESINHAVYVKC